MRQRGSMHGIGASERVAQRARDHAGWTGCCSAITATPGVSEKSMPVCLACRGVGGTNVTVEDDPSDPAGLLCVAARDITAGEELFMDYGPTYDRSRYAPDAAAGPTGAPAGQQQASDQ